MMRRTILLLVVVGFACCLLTGLVLIRDRLLPPTPAAELQADLAARLVEAERIWAGLDDLWGRLAGGETLSCQQEQVTRPYFVAWRSVDRSAYPALADLADQLNGGLRRLHEAGDSWEESCQQTAVTVSSEQVTAARQTLTQARYILDAVAAALPETP